MWRSGFKSHTQAEREHEISPKDSMQRKELSSPFAETFCGFSFYQEMLLVLDRVDRNADPSLLRWFKQRSHADVTALSIISVARMTLTIARIEDALR